MNIKTKKQNPDRIVKLETSGQIKEIILREDFLKPKESKILLCFRGKNSSGIVELNPKELENIYKNTTPKLRLLEGTKIMKFEK